MEEDLNLRIRETFDLPEQDMHQWSPLTLAFLGDSVFEIIVRTIVVNEGNTTPAKLHQHAAHIVRASSQALMAEYILPCLTEEERTVYTRGRNAKPNTKAKNASVAEYMKATGLEALLGYLYLRGEEERILSLVQKGLEVLTVK